MKFIDKFWAKIEKTDTCWNWAGGVNNGGYGYLNHIAVHRFSYELHGKTIPDNFYVDHLCRNRICVNPEHLEAVSRRENLRRGETLISYKINQTHCKRGHILTIRVDKSRKGGKKRWCRLCHNIEQNRRKKAIQVVQ